MCEPARRWRVLAAVGLMLALTQARAWGQESLWTKAADLVCRLWAPPCILPPLPAEQKLPDFRTGLTSLGGKREQPPLLLAWDKSDVKNSDGATNDNPLSLLGHEPKLAHQILFVSGFPPHPVDPMSGLIGSEQSRLLIELGVIAGPAELLSTAPADPRRGFFLGFFH